RFKIRSLDDQDDFAAMSEVITRRFSNYLRERDEGVRAGKRFSYPPNLVLIDGGKGQLSAAVMALEELGLEEIPVASLAKKFEEVYRPGEPDPIRIPRDSEALYLLQGVRDEAHRFAITFHRERRGKAMTKSVLDDIAGLGPGRKKRLLKEFGSVKKIRAMTEEELVGVSWLPEAVGRRIYERLHTPSPPTRSTTPVTVSSWRRDE
ncbi:MAG TPA: excinuclease ABC subunit C, partial [Acidimicrobiia bacterium]|nr:excinuclease ABC subunit C [Acidimicrobiia bacterium]